MLRSSIVHQMMDVINVKLIDRFSAIAVTTATCQCTRITSKTSIISAYVNLERVIDNSGRNVYGCAHVWGDKWTENQSIRLE